MGVKKPASALLALLLTSSCGDAADHSPVAESFRNACIKQNSNKPEYCECVLNIANREIADDRYREMWLLISSANPYNGREQQASQMGNALSQQDFDIYIALAKNAKKESHTKCEGIKFRHQ